MSLNTVEMAMSISVWVRLPGGMGAGGTILSRRAQSAGGFIYALSVTGGRARLRINSGNGYNLDLSTGQPIPTGDWVHLGVTFDKKFARLFIDGRPAASGVYELGIPQEETPLIVGAGQTTPGDTFADRARRRSRRDRPVQPDAGSRRDRPPGRRLPPRRALSWGA